MAKRQMALLDPSIAEKLKDTPEQRTVVGPLVAYLVNLGWSLEQIVFGRAEWRVPKSPSEATKRERGQLFHGFPVDIAVFDNPVHVSDPRHLIFMVECKQETDTAGTTQLESYFGCEPHVQLGVWANNAEPSSLAAFIYRQPDGRILLKRQKIADVPRPGDRIEPGTQRLSFRDLIAPSQVILKRTIEDLLDKVVTNDNKVTRRDEQLDQLCNLLLLKLGQR